jgi:cytochrome c peroxidase
MNRFFSPLLVLLTLFALPAIPDSRPTAPAITPEMLDTMTTLPGELNALEDLSPAAGAKVELGTRLFFDPRLSLDGRTSCASCHDPAKAYTDGLPRSIGFQGTVLRRNAPTVLNVIYNKTQFWDGRATTLDEQCKAPLLSPSEMNMIDEQHLVDRLTRIPGYRRAFQTTFGADPTLDNVAGAIAAFEATLLTPDAPFDRYMKGDKAALTTSEKRGLILFFSKAACSECHKGANFTDNEYHNLGEIPGSGAPPEISDDSRSPAATPTAGHSKRPLCATLCVPRRTCTMAPLPPSKR